MDHGQNLFADAEPPPVGERFETLLRRGGVHVERIVSSAAPDGAPCIQDHDEWVALLAGESTLEVAGRAVELRAGDTIFLPAHTPHVVRRTTRGTIWLGVHFDAGAGRM